MDILELLHYTFFQHALLGSLFASIACGIIGTYIVTRRLVFISGGITHASFGGIGLGLYAGISSIICCNLLRTLFLWGRMVKQTERYARRFRYRRVLDFRYGSRYYL